MGRVHAIGCLVGGEAWRGEWIRRLQSLNPEAIDIGLHLDLTEVPLLPTAQRSLAALVAAAWLRRLDPAAVRAEIRAQLDVFERAFGRAPAFVDGHRHVHQFAVLRQTLLDELVQRYVTRMPWLRSTRAPRNAKAWREGGWRTMVKARGIEMLGAGATTTMARRLGLAQNHCLLGVYDFQGGATRYRALLANWMACAVDADLLMCHAATDDKTSDAMNAARRAELEVLGSPSFGALLDQNGLRLAPMSRILARGNAFRHAAPQS